MRHQMDGAREPDVGQDRLADEEDDAEERPQSFRSSGTGSAPAADASSTATSELETDVSPSLRLRSLPRAAFPAVARCSLLRLDTELMPVGFREGDSVVPGRLLDIRERQRSIGVGDVDHLVKARNGVAHVLRVRQRLLALIGEREDAVWEVTLRCELPVLGVWFPRCRHAGHDLVSFLLSFFLLPWSSRGRSPDGERSAPGQPPRIPSAKRQTPKRSPGGLRNPGGAQNGGVYVIPDTRKTKRAVAANSGRFSLPVRFARLFAPAVESNLTGVAPPILKEPGQARG
jgi:hypothetical protein